MDVAAHSSPAGRYVPCSLGGRAFVPDLLPPADLASVLGRLAFAIGEAQGALGELNGAAAGLANPNLLVKPLERLEAIASSRMEGTETALVHLLEHEDDEDDEDGATREIANYGRALRLGIRDLATLPVSARLIRRSHRRLLSGLAPGRARGEPGAFRTVQNWIGRAGQGIERARYVPPPPQEVGDLMGHLEIFINAERFAGLPPLVHAALAHYFFEAVHPFADGNGRVGRVLIPLTLMAGGALRHPLLHMSPELEERRDEYLDLLLHVSRRGAWQAWIGFFLERAEASCRRTLTTIATLGAYRRDVEDMVRTARSSGLAATLLDALFASPLITIPRAQRLLGVTFRAAQLHLERLSALNFLAEDDTVRPRRFVAHGVLAIVEGRRAPTLRPLS